MVSDHQGRASRARALCAGRIENIRYLDWVIMDSDSADTVAGVAR